MRKYTFGFLATFLLLFNTLYAQPANDKFYKITSKSSGKVMQVAGASASNSALIVQGSNLEGKHQQFKLAASTSYFKIQPLISGKCLDLGGGSSADGAKIQQYDCWGTDAQLYSITAVGAYYSLIIKSTGKCIGVSGNSMAENAPIQQQTYTGANNQLWEFVEVFPYGHVDGISASQIGYKLEDKKVAVLLQTNAVGNMAFTLVNESNQTVFSGTLTSYGDKWNKKYYKIDFTAFKTAGTYTIKSNGYASYPFVINDRVWKTETRVPEYFSSFMDYQRCTETKEPNDDKLEAYIENVGNPPIDQGYTKDVRYGWFSATSHDKHIAEHTGSLNNLMWSYIYNPDFFSDDIKNGNPAIINEIKWGMSFLLKMQDTDGSVYMAVHPGGGTTPRHVFVNKSTYLTARAVSTYALGYTFFKDKDVAYANTLLTAARKGMQWIKANPNVYINRPAYWNGRFDSWILASTELYIALKDDYPAEAVEYKTFVETNLTKGKMANGAWVSNSGGQDYPAYGTDQLLSGSILYAASRYYPYSDGVLKTKIQTDITTYFNYWKNKRNNPFGWIDDIVVSWFGSCGYNVGTACKFMMAGLSINNTEIIDVAKDLIQVEYGMNPFKRTYVYGEGENTFPDLFLRPPAGSVGGVVPGIKMYKGIPVDDYRISPADYTTGEQCIGYTPATIMTLALMDKGDLIIAPTKPLVINIPSKIQAEDFLSSTGVVIGNTTDIDGSKCIGQVSNNDFIQFNIHVTVKKYYLVSYRVASGTAGGDIQLFTNNTKVLTTTIKGTGSWNTWVTVTDSVLIDVGDYPLQFKFVGGAGDYLNLNWIDIEPIPFKIPGKIEVENYSEGAGIVKGTSGDDATQILGQISNGDFTSYLTDVASRGYYVVNYRASSGNPYGGNIQMLSNSTVLKSTKIPSTGNWNTYKTFSDTVFLEMGIQTLRLNYVGGTNDLFNLNWMNVQPLPITTSAASTTNFCEGGNVVLSTANATGFNYQWYKNTAVITGATNASYKAIQSGVYKLVVAGSGVSLTSNEITVTVNPKPVASITSSTTHFCAAGSLKLTANAGTGLSYQWSNATGTISGATSQTYTTLIAGVYHVNVTNANTCVAVSNTIDVTVDSKPTANITSSATHFCEGESLKLTANAGTGLSYQWSNAVGIITGGTNQTYDALVAGTYSVKVTNTNTCVAVSNAMDVIVDSKPTANVTSSATHFCAGGSLKLTANAGVGLLYQWSNAGGIISGATNQTYDAIDAGSFLVEVTNAAGCKALSAAKVITIDALPTASITSPATSFCPGGSVVLTSSAGSSYNWLKDGTLVTGSGNTYTANAAGSYTVEVTNAAGCKAVSTAKIISIDAAPTTSITSPASSFCPGGSVILTASAGTSYKWFKDGASVTGSGITYTANSLGSYTVEVTFTGGCKALSAAKVISIDAAPTASISSTTNTFCPGGSVVLNASAGDSYKWFKDGTVVTGSAIYYTANIAGSYTVEVTYMGGCKALSAAKVISINAVPTATITSLTTSICPGNSVVLTASNGASYKWFIDGTYLTASGAIYTANMAGSYTVEVTYLGGCISLSNPKVITIDAVPTASITSPATSFCAGGSILLTSSAGASYKWFKDGTPVTGTTNTLVVNAAGSYTVELTYTGGCKAVSTATIITIDAIPSASITSPSTSFCTSGSVDLTASTGASYKWFKDGTAVTGSGITYTANMAGSYTVEITNNSNCKNTSAPKVISVTTSITWYADADGDGKGDATNTVSACTQPVGYVLISGDACPTDANKFNPELCGCGVLESTCTNQPQTITFTPFNTNQQLGDPDFNLLATSSSGLTIIFTSSNTDVAIIIDNKVQIVGPGTAIITATQSGNQLFAPSTTTQTLTIATPMQLGFLNVLDGNTILQNDGAVLNIGSAPINTQTLHKVITLKNIGTSDIIINSLTATTGFSVSQENVGNAIQPSQTVSILLTGIPIDINATTLGAINIICDNSSQNFLLNVSVDVITTTSTLGSLFTSSVELYPNPTTGNLNLIFTGTFEEVSIQFFSVEGKLIQSQEVGVASNMEEKFSIQELPSGVYFLEIKSKQGMIIKRIIKQ